MFRIAPSIWAMDYYARLLHGYVLEGLVVTRREFRSDAASPISPLDLGITWGDLADPDRADDIRFRAGRRMVSYRAQSGAVLTSGLGNADHQQPPDSGV